MRIALIAKPGHSSTGVGRYAAMLHAGLKRLGILVTRLAPSLPPLPVAVYDGLRHFGIDLRTFLLNYAVWASYPPADVYHLTSQNLAGVLLFRRPPGRVVVTVHDIIPHMLRDDPRLSPLRGRADRLFNQLAMAGLQRADQLIADSEYTRRCLVAHLGLPASRIDVSYLGVDHTHFRPGVGDPAVLRARYGLADGRRYLIYVGSEDPRKNLPTLLRALAQAQVAHPDLALIKVGRAHFLSERQHVCDLTHNLGLAGSVHFLDDVPEVDLPGLYGLAVACVMPSLYEGFGFPVLEAMACGTPTICADAASLPELAGDVGLLVPLSGDQAANFAAAIRHLLDRPRLCAQLADRGMTHAAAFRWDRCAVDAWATYRAGRARAEPFAHGVPDTLPPRSQP
ncbi:MAG: glycosyltransferase family 4 protein [Oscillochloris sp.]|nr:glycosyltransferase family 4 protein [Oscillochloris sp.]